MLSNLNFEPVTDQKHCRTVRLGAAYIALCFFLFSTCFISHRERKPAKQITAAHGRFTPMSQGEGAVRGDKIKNADTRMSICIFWRLKQDSNL